MCQGEDNSQPGGRLPPQPSSWEGRGAGGVGGSQPACAFSPSPRPGILTSSPASYPSPATVPKAPPPP